MIEITAPPTKEVPEIPRVFKADGTTVSHASEDDPFNGPVKDLGGFGKNASRRRQRTLNKAMTSTDGEAGSKQIEDDTSAYNYLEVVTPPFNLDYLAQMYEISAANFAAIHAKVSNIVGLGFTFVETAKTKRTLDGKDTEDARKKYREKIARDREKLNDVFDTFNRTDTLQEVLTKVYVDHESVGMGYIEVGRNPFGFIKYVGHIPATTIRIRRKRDGYVQITGRKAVFFRNFGDLETPNPIGEDTTPNEIICIKKYTPTSSFYGIPDVISAKNGVAGTEFAERYNLDYFENKAVPRYLITLKGATLGTAAAKSLLEFFESGLRGKNHRSLFVPLPADTAEQKVEFKIEPIEAKIQDQSFEKYNKSNLNKVLMAHRVPINKVSVSEAMAQAVAIEASKTFKNEVCTPAQKVLADKLNGIVKELTDMFLIEFNQLNLTDADTVSKIEEREIRNQLRTPNEIRQDHGRAGLPGGDKIVDITPAAKAEASAQAGATRTRDGERSAGTSTTSAEGRNPKGEGRRTS